MRVRHNAPNLGFLQFGFLGSRPSNLFPHLLVQCPQPRPGNLKSEVALCYLPFAAWGRSQDIGNTRGSGPLTLRSVSTDLRDPGKPRPNIFLSPLRTGTSARLIECLPSLQHDPNRPEDVLKVDADEDGVGGDDAADCFRYLVATRSRAISQRKLRGV